jgi:beta-lactamase regulating signal transducer with metallopeptidase domain/DUF4097 and DUF4098 domain-containing protein YvlB
VSPVAIDLIIRVTALLGAGAIIAAVLHRQSAIIRNLVWSASLGGSVVLAILAPWAPRMDVPIPGVKPSAVIPGSTPGVKPSAVIPAKAGIQRLRDTRERLTAPGPRLRGDDEAGVRSDDEPGARGNDTPAWLLVWVVGSLLVVLWGLAGRIGLMRLTRRARLVTEGPWYDTVQTTRAAIGVSRKVATYVSADVGAPVTWGAVRPVLLVPAESDSWSGELRKSVAAHEVAHIARNDYLKQLMSVAACALYWFHPLAWMSARRMRLTAERACDDQVLELGVGGEEYAAHLIGVARVSRELRLNGAVAIGMARPSTLEGRIVAVLDSNQSRRHASSRTRRFAAAIAVIALSGIAVVRPVPAIGAEPDELTTISESSAPGIAPSAVETAPSTEVATAVVAQDRDSTIERSLSARNGGRLDLDMNTGGEVIVRGWDEPRVLVKARLSGPDWRDVAVDIDRDGDGVRVESRFTRRRNTQSTSNEFEIMVPRRYDVHISSSGGGLRLNGVEGQFTGHTGGGEFILERLKGSARLTTGGGEIHVSDSDLSGSVSTGGGTVRISSVSGGLRGSSGSGPVIYGRSEQAGRSTTDISSVQVNSGGSRIRVGDRAEHSAGSLFITKAGGDVDLDAAPNGAHIRTGGGDVRIGRGGGLVEATTGGGNVTIGPIAGAVAAGTGAGEVRIVVEKVSWTQFVEASSGKGRIIIELPRDFDGTLDLETAHTESHESTARILSDWDLERAPLTGWDAREGTARRYLRATAVLGNGSGRVRVKTVNGDIEIRRR